MDGFSIIQNFFTRMRCNSCTSFLESDGIQLIRHDKGVYIVNIRCTACKHQMGVAMVGLEGAEHVADRAREKFIDPELTEEELERLAQFEPVGYDDVLDAHKFFTNLGSDWQQFVPEEMRQLEIEPELESEAS